LPISQSERLTRVEDALLRGMSLDVRNFDGDVGLDLDARQARFPGYTGIPSTMASPPTITQGISNAASTIAGSVGVFPYSAVNPFRYTGALPTLGVSFPDDSMVSSESAVATGVYKATGPFFTEFDFYGTKFELYTKGSGSTYRLRVDGQLVTASPANGPPSDGTLYHILVDFTSVGGAAHRRIMIEHRFDCRFGGIKIGPTDTIWPISRPRTYRVVWLADSICDGTGGTGAVTAWPFTIGQLLGWDDVILSAQGAVGYLADGGGGAKSTFRQRVITDVIKRNPDIVVIQGGINDTSFTQAQVLAEARLLFDQIKSALPNVYLFVTSAYWPTGSPTQAAQNVSAAIKQAAQERWKYTTYIDIMGEGWITGTGHVGGTTGTGNADIFTSSDSTHPTQAGQDYLARRFAAGLLSSGKP
jgi:lysophospholipase L1-like esterase